LNGASALLADLRRRGLHVSAINGDRIHVLPAGVVTEHDRDKIRTHRAELLTLLANPVTDWQHPPANDLPLTANDPDRWCWPNSDAMNGAEINIFIGRVQKFIDRGIDEPRAEVLADKLVIRDRQRDDRHICLECVNLQPGRCGRYRAAGLQSPQVGTDLATLLQRCPAFIQSQLEGSPRHGET
jgi:hypothetical protein